MIVKSLKDPLLSILLTGGEPFLREDLVQICEIFDKYNKTSKVIIPTNGYLSELIFKKTKEILNKTNLSVEVIVSIDGFEKTSAKTRGLKGIFKKYEKTINLLKKIKNNRLLVSITTTVSKENYDEIIDLVDFNNMNWKIPHKIQYVRSYNEVYNLDPKILAKFSQKDEDYMLPTFEKIKKLNEILKKKVKEKTVSVRLNNLERDIVLDILKNKKKRMFCVAGIYDGVIFPNGEVSLCELTLPFGNLKETDYDFYKLWNSKKANKMREKIKNCVCTHDCNLFDSMTHNKKILFKIFEK